MELKNKIITHLDNKCYACKTCELICSYHHKGVFQPSKSSISVERDHVNGIWSWKLDESCDNCEGEEEPLCAKFCFYDAIIIKEEEEK